jgi:chemotaxis signal transduction protein
VIPSPATAGVHEGAPGGAGAPPHILVFQVGSRVFAADVRDVVRIAGGEHDDGGGAIVPQSCLGRPFAQARGLVVRQGDAELVLAVDGVLGVREPAPGDLHPLPALAALCLGTAAVRGVVVLDDAPTPLIDLPTLVREQRDSVAAPMSGEVPHA